MREFHFIKMKISYSSKKSKLDGAAVACGLAAGNPVAGTAGAPVVDALAGSVATACLSSSASFRIAQLVCAALERLDHPAVDAP